MAAGAAHAPNRAHAFASALFEELARGGVRDVCLSPGSRSTPLAVAVAQQPALRCWTHVDERAAGLHLLVEEQVASVQGEPRAHPHAIGIGADGQDLHPPVPVAAVVAVERVGPEVTVLEPALGA